MKIKYNTSKPMVYSNVDLSSDYKHHFHKGRNRHFWKNIKEVEKYKIAYS